MKVKVQFRKTKYESAEIEINDEELLTFVNEVGMDYFTSLEAVREDENEDFEGFVQEYLEDRVFYDNSVLAGVPRVPAGDSIYDIDKVEVE